MTIKKSLERLGKIVLTSSIGLLPITGCQNNYPGNAIGEYAGFKSRSIGWIGGSYQIALIDTSDDVGVFGNYIRHEDRFNDIEIHSDSGEINPNHPLLKYANPDSLKAVDRALRREE